MTKSTKVIAALGIIAGLGVAALPISSFAAGQEVTVKVNVGESVSISGGDQDGTTQSGQNATTEISMNANEVNTTGLKSKIKAATNAAKGYKLTVKDKDTDTSLKNGAYSIPAANTVSAGTSAWNVKGGDSTGVFSTGKAITAADQLVKKTSAPANDVIDMTYGVSTSPDQATGTYQDVIVYTVSVND